MNTDYTIYITTKNGKTWKYQKQNKNWTQTAPTGKTRQLTAEQLLSHLLPPLAHDQPNLNVTVKRKIKKSQKHKSYSLIRRTTQRCQDCHLLVKPHPSPAKRLNQCSNRINMSESAPTTKTEPYTPCLSPTDT